MVSTWFAYVRCVTSVRRTISYMREQAAISAAGESCFFASQTPVAQNDGEKDKDQETYLQIFSEIILLPSL